VDADGSWLTDEGLSVVWEQMVRLSAPIGSPTDPGCCGSRPAATIRRGGGRGGDPLGSASTRGLIGAVRRSSVLGARKLADWA